MREAFKQELKSLGIGDIDEALIDRLVIAATFEASRQQKPLRAERDALQAENERLRGMPKEKYSATPLQDAFNKMLWAERLAKHTGGTEL